MVVTPVAAPVTNPLSEPIVAAPVFVLVHNPPLIASVRLLVPPEHTVAGPAIAVGVVLTVTMVAVVHPVGSEYTIVAGPVATPVTIPLEAPIVATEGARLFQLPPPASVSAIVAPTHNAVGPPIAAGTGLTVTLVVT